MTRMLLHTTLSIFGLLFIISSCQEKKIEPCELNPVVSALYVNPSFDNDVLYLDTAYMVDNFVSVKLSKLKFYFHSISNPNSATLQAALFDYSKGTLMFETTQDFYSSDTIRMNLGVDNPDNSSDPSAFSNESPLNILNSNDMHWGWNPGYIYVKIEGMCDTIPNGIDEYNQPISFHVGKIANLKQLQFTNINWMKFGDRYEMNMKLDMKSFFSLNGGINLKIDNTCHTAAGQEVLAEKIINNFKESLSLN